MKQSDGSFELISALDQNMCIDLSGAQTENGSNVQLYESNGTKAQRWVIEKELTIDNIAQDHRNDIDDGTYVIKSAINHKFRLDVSGGSSENEANVQIYSENGSKAQSWIISHDEKGYVIIANEGSGKVLDVSGGGTANGTNIHQYSFNQTSAQKWIAVKQSDGSFEFISALDQNMCIDLSGAQAENGSNVQLYESNGTKAQRWYISD